MTQHPEERYDILVIGKSGNGKSAVCNTLLGQEKFQTSRSMSTATKTVDYGDRVYNNMAIRIIDTPDITNCGLDLATDRRTEVGRWKSLMASSTPSLLLVAVRCDVRYTSEEYAIYEEINRMWSAVANTPLDRNLVVAFTFGDRQDYDITADVKDPPPELKQILSKAKNRYLVFRNNETESRPQQAQVCFQMMQEEMMKGQSKRRDGLPCCSCL